MMFKLKLIRKMEEKQSNFEKTLMEKMDQQKDPKTLAKRAFRQAQSLVTQQIAALEHERVNLEILAEEKADALKDATFTTKFTLEKYDRASEEVAEIQDRLAEIDSTVEKRKKLLETWE